MQRIIKYKGAVSLLEQLEGNCQALGHELPGSDLLLSQLQSMSIISLTMLLKIELARGKEREKEQKEKQTNSPYK